MSDVFSQGKTIDELEENIKKAYQFMMADEDFPILKEVFKKELEIQMRKDKNLLKS